AGAGPIRRSVRPAHRARQRVRSRHGRVRGASGRPQDAGRPRRCVHHRRCARRRRDRARRGRLVAVRPPLHRTRPGVRAQVARAPADRGPRDAAGRRERRRAGRPGPAGRPRDHQRHGLAVRRPCLTVNALLLAVGTLTALPVPAPRAVNSRVAGRAMLLAPIAVLPLAVLVGGLAAAGEALGLPALLTALLCVGAGALGTRGLHWDGLADTADGLSSSYDRDRALEVMRSGDIGPSGVVAVVLVLGGQAAALAGAIAAGHGPFAAVVGVLTGRMVLALCCVRGIPAARSGGLGATVAGTEIGR